MGIIESKKNNPKNMYYLYKLPTILQGETKKPLIFCPKKKTLNFIYKQ